MSNGILSYTSKTYDSIRADLIEAISSLTNKWQNYAEDDPGIVLIDLMAALGDMLCYNLDYQILETFPQRVTQRRNAADIFSLVGYKMPWYRSASCTVNITSDSAVAAYLPKYTPIVTGDGISYLVMEDTYVSSLLAATDLELTQGTLVLMSGLTIESIDSEDRIYLSSSNADQDNIELVIDGTSWTLVDNLLTNYIVGTYFEFNVDENDLPYIKLVPYYQNYITENSVITVRYLNSLGSNGIIGANTLSTFGVPIYNTAGAAATTNLTIVSNTASEGGLDPETVDEARESAVQYATTLNTAVTLRDFEILTDVISGVGKSYAVDISIDSGLDPYVLNLYVVTDDYSPVSASLVTAIETELSEKKVSSLEVNIIQGLTQELNYNIIVYCTRPYSTALHSTIETAILTALEEYFTPADREFEEEIPYLDVVTLVQGSSSIIRYISLTPLTAVVAGTLRLPKLGTASITLSDDPGLTANEASIVSMQVGGEALNETYILDINSGWDNITDDLVLEESSVIGTDLIWISSHPEIIGDGTDESVLGQVVPPAVETEVYLTALITTGTASRNIQFVAIVPIAVP